MPVIHKEEIKHKIHPTRESIDSKVLQVKDLNFHYPGGDLVLKDISFELLRGEKVAVVGPNGAGKSTLMLHLNGILQGEGEITVDGIRVEKDSLPIIRSKIGLVFQNPEDQLFSPTVFEDIAFGPLHMGFSEEEILARVKYALSCVGMEGYEDRLSHHLSIGEKKRISIATVLAMKSEILVLDEPTSGLDPRSRRSFINFLINLPNTILVSTHDMHLVRDVFERMIIIDKGTIVVDGEVRDLLENQDLLEKHGLEMPC